MPLENLPRLQRAAHSRPQTGIVHLGLGAFFRAHGAVYIQEAMALSGGDWGVVGVSLRSSSTRDKLRPQNWAYSTTELSGERSSSQIIDVLNDVLVAPEDPASVLRAMADEATKIVSLTITEKGYCLGAQPGSLDFGHPDIVHDLAHDIPVSAPGYLVRALEMRRQNGLRPFTVMSLDNLPSNGLVVRRVVCEMAKAINPELADWIEAQGAFPSTMVDRIVPATTDQLIRTVAANLGAFDAAPVGHEPFRQWVIEDNFVMGERPDFGAVGAQLVVDVTAYEHMKLRMLNGAHSALAYLGTLAGFQTVFEATSNAALSNFLKVLWNSEIIPSIQPPAGTDLHLYADQLLARFLNPKIEHRLIQIAMDGSQKLPQRILSPLFENHESGRPYRHLLLVLAGWIKFLSEVDDKGRKFTVIDPLSADLTKAVRTSHTNHGIVREICANTAIFGRYSTAEISEELAELLSALQRQGTLATIGDIGP